MLLKNIPRWALWVILMLLFTASVGVCHGLLRNDRVYSVVQRWVKTYEMERHDGIVSAYQVSKPYTRPNNENMLHFDAEHYQLIKKYLYLPPCPPCSYAFFPLFPLLWRLTHLGAMGISAVNWILFGLGMLLLLQLFKKVPRWEYLLLFCMPYLVIFMIPYSEALFFVCISLGILGLVKERYWVYFLGFMLGAMTRSAGNIIVVAWVIVDVLNMIYSKGSLKKLLVDITKHLLPVVIGIAAVVLFQHSHGAEHWFQYVVAQGEWGKELSLPVWPFTNWSVENESVTNPLLFILTIPALVWLGSVLIGGLRKNRQEKSALDTMQQLRILSVLFFVGNVLLALFTQKGCMYSLSRLLTCTPFFVFLLLDFANSEIKPLWKWMIGVFFVLAAVLCFNLFTYIGCWVVFLMLALVFYHSHMGKTVKLTVCLITIFLNVLWTAYLFNNFLTGSWIFT